MINQISLHPSSIARSLGLLAFALVLSSMAWQLAAHLTQDARIYRIGRLFSVDAENNIPTAFSALLLLFAALLLTVITILERKRNRSSTVHWATLSVGFLFMAVDETFWYHERLILPIRRLVGDGDLGVFYFAWVIPGIALVLVLGLFFARFLLRLSAPTRLAFLIAATLYLGGAIGVELIGGHFAELHGRRNVTYNMIVTVEESLEMGGAITFIWALLVYIANEYGEVRFRFG